MKILSASGMEIIEDVNCNFNVLSSQSSDISLEQIENSNEDLDGKTVGDLPLAIANTQEDKDEEVGNSLFCDVAFFCSALQCCFLNWFLSITVCFWVSSEISLESNTAKKASQNLWITDLYEDENDSVYEFNVELSNPEAWMKSLREMDIFFLLIFVSLVLYLLGVSILYK